MPTDLWRLLAQLSGTTPPFEGGPGGRSPTPMAPGQAYPDAGGNLPADPWDYGGYPGDFGFDLVPGPSGYYFSPRPAFSGSGRPSQLGLYTPPARPTPWEQSGGPLDPYSDLGNLTARFPPATAQVWGVPVLPDPFRQFWVERLRQLLEQQRQEGEFGPTHF